MIAQVRIVTSTITFDVVLFIVIIDRIAGKYFVGWRKVTLLTRRHQRIRKRKEC